MKTKKSIGMFPIIIIILILVIIGIGVYCTNQNSQKTNNNPEEPKNSIVTEEKMYESVLSDYKKALSEYDENDVDSLDNIEKKYTMVNPTIIFQIVRYKDEENEISYTFYDIDKNGVKDLIVGVSNNANDLYAGAVYSYDQNTSKPVKIYYQETMERGSLSIYDNGIIFSEGSGGASLHYYNFGKINNNGNAFENIENIEEEYTQEGKDATYKNYKTNKVLNYKNLNEIKNKYIPKSNTIKYDNYNKL